LRHNACSVWLSCTSVQSFALRCGHVVVKRTALSWQTFLLGSVGVVQVSLVQQRVESGRVCSLTRELPGVPQDNSQVTLRRACGALPGGTRGLHATLTVCRRTGKATMFSPRPATRTKTREAAPHTLEMRIGALFTIVAPRLQGSSGCGRVITARNTDKQPHKSHTQ
jgi:hypothetical protein